MITPREDAIAARKWWDSLTDDERFEAWRIENDNAIRAALGAAATTYLGQQTVHSTTLGRSITGFVSQEHGYTCGLCEWGRVDQPRSLADYVAHMNAEHPIEHAEARAEFKRGELRAAAGLMLGGGHWVDLASPETAEALAQAIDDMLQETGRVEREDAPALLAAMRETGR